MTAPLTRGQSLFHAGQALAGDQPIYNQAWRFDLAGPLDPERFAAAFDALARRADSLRMVLEETPEGPRRRVLTAPPRAVEHVDLRDADADALDAWLAKRARRPFALAEAAYDAALIHLGAERWIWFFNQHHIFTDAWGVSRLFAAVFETYEALADGPAAPSPPLPSYEIACAKAAAPSPQIEAFWRDQAASAPPPARLYNRTNTGGAAAAARIVQPLGPARLEKLAALAAQPGVRALSPAATRFTIFAAAFAAFTARVSDQRRFALAVPVHNRTTPALRDTPGLFVDVLPLILELPEGATFREVITCVTDESLRALRHAAPGAATPETARAANLALNVIHAAFPQTEGLERRATWLSSGAVDPGHDLRLHVWDMAGDGKLEIAFDLNRAAYDADQRRRIPSHFLAVLDAMLADPDQPIDQVALTTPEERAWIEASTVAPTTPRPEPLSARITRQAAARPDALAIEDGADAVTYGDLDAWSEAIAEDLAAAGVRPGARVAIHMHRSAAYLAAVLGVWKAGAAFAPIDARAPTDRRRIILEDVTPSAILVDPRVDPLTDVAVPVLTVDAPRPAPATRSEPTATADDVAYVLYTSGSTGRPKGVAVEHGAIARYVKWAARVYGDDRPVSMPFFTAIGFDLTLTSLFAPLITGGRVRVYPEPPGDETDLAVLQVFADDAVDLVKLTPAHLALALETGAAPKRVRALIVGGEDFKTALAARTRRALGSDVALFNEYGPTEATVGCMIHRFDPAHDQGVSVPIGVPADDCVVKLLDAGGNPVPRDVVGALAIGGARLARGYHGRADLTAERFVRDPDNPAARLYLTGDRARFDARGRLVYLGRDDDQVKIRGVRIETAEIADALAALPGVREAVVLARPAPDGPARSSEPEQCCTRCGLSSRYPDVTIGADGVCSICTELEGYRDAADVYFSDMDALAGILADAKARACGQYDCIMLTSGGKDSTYALARLAEMGPRILALTLDNGFLSEGAKANITRVTAALGVDHRYVSTPAMNAIFVDSLERHANVCQGCFKTIYTLATQVALDVGAPVIVTGLSRGQFFETRLTPDLFKDRPPTASEIDALVLEARKAYHRTDDAVARHLDVSAFDDDAVFDQVRFVDFYRYCDVSVDAVYAYINTRLPWSRPADTGRSSNCLINDVGIYAHQRLRGFHNYALPYSWDVRMGHKRRDAAMAELDDDIDPVRVRSILDEIGFDATRLEASGGEPRLIAYVASDAPLDPAALRSALRGRLMPEMIPSAFVPIGAPPLTANGKIDVAALPVPDDAAHAPPVTRPPAPGREATLAQVWAEVLGREAVGAEDNFYDVGGDSIAAIRIAARARARGVAVEPAMIFRHQTVAALAAAAGAAADPATPQQAEAGEPFALADLSPEALGAIAATLGESDDAPPSSG